MKLKQYIGRTKICPTEGLTAALSYANGVGKLKIRGCTRRTQPICRHPSAMCRASFADVHHLAHHKAFYDQIPMCPTRMAASMISNCVANSCTSERSGAKRARTTRQIKSNQINDPSNTPGKIHQPFGNSLNMRGNSTPKTLGPTSYLWRMPLRAIKPVNYGGNDLTSQEALTPNGSTRMVGHEFCPQSDQTAPPVQP